MFLLFLKSYWKQLVVGIALSLLLYTGYHKVYSIGYSAATAEYVKKTKDYEDKLDKRIANIEANSAALLEGANKDKAALSKDLSNILNTIKGKPLYILEEGKCKPAPILVDTYNETIKRINKEDIWAD